MRDSSSLGTVLEPAARGEDFGARSVGPWGGWIYTTLTNTLAGNFKQLLY
jgi:hypothetical protein